MSGRRCSATITILAWCTAIPSVWLGLAAGCGDQEASMTVRMPASRRPDLDEKMVSRGTLSIPRDEALNYPKFRSGQEGPAARGEAKAIGNDGARCRAGVKGEGSAWGEFVLAYCFDNVTGKTLDAVIEARLTVRQTVTAEAGKGDASAAASATGSLSFFVEDASTGRVLKEERLISGEFDRGPHSSTTQHDLIFDVKFEPGRGYYLVLGGRADVRGKPSQAGTVELEVTDVSLEIRWQTVVSSAQTEAGTQEAFDTGATAPQVADE